MSEQYDMNGHPGVIDLTGDEVVGIIDPQDYSTNQTRYTTFRTEYLVEWANAAHDIYNGSVCVQFTPEAPMAAGYWDGENPDRKPTMSVAVSPVFGVDRYVEKFGDSDGE